jgi:hypothetical protein
MRQLLGLVCYLLASRSSQLLGLTCYMLLSATRYCVAQGTLRKLASIHKYLRTIVRGGRLENASVVEQHLTSCANADRDLAKSCASIMPSSEAVDFIKRQTGNLELLEVAGGNGFWTAVLRRQRLKRVIGTELSTQHRIPMVNAIEDKLYIRLPQLCPIGAGDAIKANPRAVVFVCAPQAVFAKQLIMALDTGQKLIMMVHWHHDITSPDSPFDGTPGVGYAFHDAIFMWLDRVDEQPLVAPYFIDAYLKRAIPRHCGVPNHGSHRPHIWPL